MPTPLSEIFGDGAQVNHTNASNPCLEIFFSAVAAVIRWSTLEFSSDFDLWMIAFLKLYEQKQKRKPGDQSSNIVVNPPTVFLGKKGGEDNRKVIRFVVDYYTDEIVDTEVTIN